LVKNKTMKTFVLNSPNNNGMLKTPANVLNSPTIHGISMDLKLEQFMVGGYNFGGAIVELKKEIKRIAAWTINGVNANKKVSIAIMCGDFASNIPDVEYVYLTEAHHEGVPDDAVPHGISVPVPYDSNYLSYLSRFIEWFAGELKSESKVYDTIDSIKITGNNQKTPEMRMPNQDMTVGDSFYNAAVKWKDVEYTTTRVTSFTIINQSLFQSAFPDKTLILPIISGLAGFPCINANGEICKPNQRPDLTRQIVTEIAQPDGIIAGWCYMNPTSKAPTYISAKPCYYQTQNIVPTYPQWIHETILNAQSQNCEIFEMQAAIFKKYPI